MKFFLTFLIPLLLTIAACTTTQKGAAIGAVGGSVIGGVIGNQSGSGPLGAGIGAAAGGLTGALIGEHMEKKFCPTCGAEYTSDVQFCPKDGIELKLKQ